MTEPTTIGPEPTEPSATPPERDGTCRTCRSFGGVGITSDDGEDVFGECGEGIEQRSHGVWSTFGCRLYRPRLAAPAPAPATRDVERPSSAQVHAAADVHRGYVNLDHQPDDYPDHVDIAEAMLEAALARPTALVVPEDVTTLAFRHGHLPHARWMVVLKAKNPEDDNIRMGWGETAEDALAHARSKRDGVS